MAGLFEEYGIDPDEIEDGPNYDVPKGTYVFEVSNAIIWQSDDEDGRKALRVDYLLDDEEGTSGQKSEWFNLPADPGNLTDREAQSMGFLKQRLISLGVPRDQLATVEPEQLIGITGTLQIVETAGKGKNKGKTFKNIRNVRVAEEEAPVVTPTARKVAAKAETAVKNPFARK